MGHTTESEGPSLSFRLRSQLAHWVAKALRALDGSARKRYGW